MRLARSIPTLDPIEVGDHVCWLVAPDEDFAATAAGFIADAALFGDKVLILGPAGAISTPHATERDLVVLDPARNGSDWDPAALGALVSREATAAGGQGFRALRVLAQMDQLWPGPATAVGQVARHELDLDAVIAGGGALMVCTYRTDSFEPSVLHQAAGVHPQHLGTSRSALPSFRIFSQGPDCWSVSGVVDSEGAVAFGVAVRELAARSPTPRLRCEDLELIDAAGMRALAAAAGQSGQRLVITGAGPTVRRAWTLSGHDRSCPEVEMEP